MNEASITTSPQLVMDKPQPQELSTDQPHFPFFKLPGELRNRVYGFLLTDTRAPSLRKMLQKDDLVVKVPEILEHEIHLNDLARRKERRQRLTPVSTGLSKKSRALARKYHFLNATAATDARLAQKVTDLPALLETAILAVCCQTRDEGLHVLYSENTFVVMFPLDEQKKPFHARFPGGIDVSQIQRLRIEIQLNPPTTPNNGWIQLPFLRGETWTSFHKMINLKHLQINVTFRDESSAAKQASLFNRVWRRTSYYDTIMKDLVAAIPKHVQMQFGLTLEQRECGDYGGYEPAKGCVLRKIFKTYEGLRGTDADREVLEPLNFGAIDRLAVDGDGEDSDAEHAPA